MVLASIGTGNAPSRFFRVDWSVSVAVSVGNRKWANATELGGNSFTTKYLAFGDFCRLMADLGGLPERPYKPGVAGSKPAPPTTQFVRPEK